MTLKLSEVVNALNEVVKSDKGRNLNIIEEGGDGGEIELSVLSKDKTLMIIKLTVDLG